MTLRWRLTIWSTLLLAAFVAIFGVVAVYSVRYFMIQRVDENLDRQTSARLSYIMMRQDLNIRDLANEDRIDTVFYTIINGQGQIDRADRNVPINPELVLRALEGETSTYYQKLPDGTSLRVMLKPILLAAGGPIVGALQAATPLGFIDDLLNEITVLLVIVSVILLLVGGLGSALLTGNALRAVSRVTQRVNRIELAQNLSQRLPEPRVQDEVGTLVSTFNRLLDRLQAAFDTQRRFVADSSHELRTPLTVIKSNLHMLRHTGEPEERAELLTVTEGEVARLNRMVDDLLYMAQMQAGHDLRPVLRPVELDSLLLDVFARARSLAAPGGHRIALAHEDVASAMGDRDQLQHLLLNLVDNAVKYTPDGGSISLGLWAEGDWARFEVSDTGPGIEQSDLPHIFDRFYRTDEARRRERAGAGLGLSIVRSIAEAHGGHIEVFSERGEGTTFRLWLRLVETKPPVIAEGESLLDAEHSSAPLSAYEPHDTLTSTTSEDTNARVR